MLVRAFKIRNIDILKSNSSNGITKKQILGLLCLGLISACSLNSEIQNDELIGCWIARGVSPYKDVIQVLDNGRFSQRVIDNNVEVSNTLNGTWYRQISLGKTYLVFNGVAVSYSYCQESEFACQVVNGSNASPWKKTNWPVLPTRSLISNSWKLIVSDDTGHFYQKTKCSSSKL